MGTILTPLLNAYKKIYRYLTDNRFFQKDVDERNIHALIISTLGISFLMWTHALLAQLACSNPWVATIGYTCSVIQLFCLELLRWRVSIFAVTNIMLSAACAFTIVMSFITGGFLSSSLVWFAAAPTFAAMSSGKKGIFTWTFIVGMIYIAFFLGHISGFQYPVEFSEKGLFLKHFMLIFGWMGMASAFSFYFLVTRQRHEEILNEQTKKIDDLFRVLFHDLANSIGRVGIGISIGKRDNGENSKRGLEIASQAADSMLEITQNVRKIYAATKGKAELDLNLCSLNDAVDYIRSIMQDDLNQKDLEILFDAQKHEGLKLLVDHVSFKNQVLANIVSNAIKFSKQGGKIHIEASALDTYTYLLEIRDEGIGMPEHILKTLFDLNKKTSRSGTSGEIGTGFGMHIMKSFVEIYQGKVIVESVEGDQSGTTFKLVLKGEWPS